MAQGLSLIFDKSSLESLNLDEAILTNGHLLHVHHHALVLRRMLGYQVRWRGCLRGTITLVVSTWTSSPRWLQVSVRRVTTPRSGLEREGATSITSVATDSWSPARVGWGQEISTPRPMRPSAKGTLSTSNRAVTAAVCQPLAQ